MNEITAPYAFVPLSDKVVCPDWLKRGKDGQAPPVHDVPFEKGICGTLEVEIEAETPIFIRGFAEGRKRDEPQTPFKLSDGTYAIPGTALRGALRNIIEIISFSKFRNVNNHRYAVRDLNNRDVYGQWMADIVKVNGRGEPMPLVNAGWLRNLGTEDSPKYQIEVCDFAKFEYRGLMDVASKKGIRNFQPGKKQSAVQKYRDFGNDLSVSVKVDWRRPMKIGQRAMMSEYGVAGLTNPAVKGTLVMTGQPSSWTPDATGRRPGAGSPKHHDFVFVEAKTSKSLEVSDATFGDFEFAHSDRGQQNKLGKSLTPNAEWAFWCEKLKPAGQGRVPVFFLTDETGKVSSFGLAMMFRLPYRNSIHDAIGKVNPQHVDSLSEIDFAEGLFGTVRGDRKSGKSLALKGRIGITHARASSPTQLGNRVTAVLGGPKASYYPNYVEQVPGTPGASPPGGVYKTWMNDDARPRGWKRYRVLTETWIPPLPQGADGRSMDISRVGTTFSPLPAKTKFRAHLDVHNLLPEELGALLWALDFGGDANARHSLGMARPLGFGRCKMNVTKHELRNMDDSQPDVPSLRAAFETYMNKQVPGWQKSHQIAELVAIAQPVKSAQAKYQTLSPNEFTTAKKFKLALPSVAAHAPMAVAMSAGSTSSATAVIENGSRVAGQVSEKTTKKGDAMLTVAGRDGVFHPTSAKPASLNVGDVHSFIVMASGNPLSLKWIDPDGPPPPPVKKPAPPPQRGDFRR